MDSNPILNRQISPFNASRISIKTAILESNDLKKKNSEGIAFYREGGDQQFLKFLSYLSSSMFSEDLRLIVLTQFIFTI